MTAAFSNVEPEQPLVSAIMPTMGRRTRFAQMAIECFAAQTYPNCELVVLEDYGIHPPKLRWDTEARLGPRVRWLTSWQTLPRGPSYDPLGAKFNILTEAAKGDFIIFWADDDWSHPTRIARQMEALGDKEWCAIREIRYVDVRNHRTYRHECHNLDGTFLFRRALWERARFPREGATGFWHGRTEPVAVIDDLALYVGTLHDGNIAPKALRTDEFEIPADLLKFMTNTPMGI